MSEGEVKIVTSDAVPQPKIVVVGSANMDLVVKTDRIPVPGETVLGGEFYQLPGGKGANQAVAAARLGGNVTLVACVGQDGFGSTMLDQYAVDCIDTSHIRRVDGHATGVALIGVDRLGQNSIIVAPGANALLDTNDIKRAESAIRSAQVVLAQLEISVQTVTAAMKAARQYGAVTLLNPAPFHSGDKLPADLLAATDVLIPNEHEALALLGIPHTANIDYVDVAAELLLTGVGAVVVTLGDQGSVIADKYGVRLVHALPVEAVDSTAAGDCFCGALAVALGEGEDLDIAVKFASSAAAISVTRMGAQPSLPARAEVGE